MRLEDQDRTPVVERLHRVQKRLQLARVVGVVVVDVRAVELALELKTASGAVEAGKAVLDGMRADPKADGRGRSREGVLDIVSAGNMQRDVRKAPAAVDDVEMGIREITGLQTNLEYTLNKFPSLL